MRFENVKLLDNSNTFRVDEKVLGQGENPVYGQKSTCRSLIVTVPRKRITGA